MIENNNPFAAQVTFLSEEIIEENQTEEIEVQDEEQVLDTSVLEAVKEKSKHTDTPTIQEPPTDSPPKTGLPLQELSNSWKKEGLLTESFELPDDITVEDFKKLIKEDIYNRTKGQADAEIELEKQKLREEKGINVIEIAEKISKGVSLQTATDSQIIDSLVSLDIDEDSDDAYDNREKLIRTVNRLKGLTDKKIDRLIEVSRDNGEDLEDAEEAKEYLKNLKADREKADIDRKVVEDRKREEDIKSFHTTVKSIIDSGTIQEGVNKDKFFKDLIDKTEIVNIDTDGIKVPRKLSKWEKAQIENGVIITPTTEALTSDKLNNFLKAAHLLMYGEPTKEIKKKVKQEIEDELDNFLRNTKQDDSGDTFSIPAEFLKH